MAFTWPKVHQSTLHLCWMLLTQYKKVDFFFTSSHKKKFKYMLLLSIFGCDDRCSCVFFWWSRDSSLWQRWPRDVIGRTRLYCSCCAKARSAQLRPPRSASRPCIMYACDTIRLSDVVICYLELVSWYANLCTKLHKTAEVLRRRWMLQHTRSQVKQSLELFSISYSKTKRAETAMGSICPDEKEGLQFNFSCSVACSSLFQALQARRFWDQVLGVLRKWAWSFQFQETTKAECSTISPLYCKKESWKSATDIFTTPAN